MLRNQSLIHAIIETRPYHVHVDVWGTTFEIIAFIRTVVGNKCICITRTAALMSRFTSGVRLKKNPHVIRETPAGSDCGSPPSILISWCALRISVNIAASNRVDNNLKVGFER
jgi:hypothetical protein